jgi:hypothetical protein
MLPDLTEKNSADITFEPKYYFFNEKENRSPRLWNNKLWYIVAEANVSFNKDAFWKVVVCNNFFC